jgi:hypothetical protein
VFIVNTSSKEIEFTVHEWISNCGWPGVRVNETTLALTAGASIEVALMNDADPYKCREDFVFDCYTFGGEKDCREFLRVFARIR